MPSKEKHNSKTQKLEMNVTGSCSNDAMQRQISEGVRIDKIPEGSLMNSESEWNCFNVPRAIVGTLSIDDFGCHGRSIVRRRGNLGTTLSPTEFVT